MHAGGVCSGGWDSVCVLQTLRGKAQHMKRAINHPPTRSTLAVYAALK